MRVFNSNPVVCCHPVFQSVVLLLILLAPALNAQTSSDGSVNANGSDNGANLQYTSSLFSLGVGIDSEFDLVGEITGVFFENYKSALVGQGWIGSEGAGGLKLNYNWVINGQLAGEDENGNPLYADGMVLKSFVAIDQGNSSDHRKLTFGGGLEKQSYFASLYGMAGLTDEQLISTQFSSTTQTVTGNLNGRDFTRTDTFNTTTLIFEEVYEWGLGLRGGRTFDDGQVRLTLGADYEDGHGGADQFTASARLDKLFGNTGHMLSFRAAWAHKSGPFEIDDNDFRGGIYYTYHFGETHRPVQRYRREQYETGASVSGDLEDRSRSVFVNQVDVSSEANFKLDEAKLTPQAINTLADIYQRAQQARLIGKIKVTGHTCNLGTDNYNIDLSERRAQAVTEYFVSRGFARENITVDWKGESQPRYSNETEATRKLNRRVEIEFVTEQEVVKPPTAPTEPVLEWRQVEVPTEAPWIRRALRTPVSHKREVDTYRTEQSSTDVVEGDPVFANENPAAQDDAFTVVEDSSANALDVLANDSDGDGDALTITSFTSPANGSVTNSGSQLTYTPNAGFTGTDSFSYSIDDGFGGTQTAQVTITVIPDDPLPEANADNFDVASGIQTSLDVLANDSDPEGQQLTIVSITQPGNGSATILGGTVGYTPAAEFSGTDSFTYTIEDTAGNQATATVTVNVLDNQPPVAVDDSAMSMNSPRVEVDVLANDSDPDGDPLTIVSVTQPDRGTVTITANNTVFFESDTFMMITAQFTYTISDPFGNTDTATVTVMAGD